MKKKMAQLHRRPWFLWIGGACFLVGSLVAGSVSLASSAASGPSVSGTVIANQGTAGSSSWPVSASQSGTWQQEITDGTNVLGTPTNPLRTDPTGTTTQPVSGSVGLSAGSNDIGNVGISGSLPAGSNDIGTVHVASPSQMIGSEGCFVASGSTQCSDASDQPSAGDVLTTLSVRCNILSGQKLEAEFVTGAFNFDIPVTFQVSPSGSGTDNYSGTLTNLDVPVQSGPQGTFSLLEDYTASPGNGAFCTMNWIATSGS
jgi:hypothetical protein